MSIGTKSLLFGCHQFVIHPIFVLIAWVRLYHQLPNPKEMICIVIHDWGYWGKPNMDGDEGEEHSLWAAHWAEKHLGFKYLELCQYHSRFWARKHECDVSRLCMPDKLGVAMMPTWLWVLLGNLTGEIKEYMSNAKYEINKGFNHKNGFKFFRAYKKKCQEWVEDQELLTHPERGELSENISKL